MLIICRAILDNDDVKEIRWGHVSAVPSNFKEIENAEFEREWHDWAGDVVIYEVQSFEEFEDHMHTHVCDNLVQSEALEF
jgi:hypothetical protein